MSHTSQTLTADDAYDQLMAWVADYLKTQGLAHLSDQTKHLILLQLITETPDLARRLSPALAKQLADAASVLLHRLPPELAERVRQIVRTLSEPTARAVAARRCQHKEAAR